MEIARRLVYLFSQQDTALYTLGESGDIENKLSGHQMDERAIVGGKAHFLICECAQISVFSPI